MTTYCAERGEALERPASGRLLIRTTPETHRMVLVAAEQRGISANQWAADTLARQAAAELGGSE